MCSFDGEHADVCYAFAPVYYFLAFSGGFNLALVIAPFGIRLFSVIVRLCIVRSWDGVYCMFRYIEFELYRLFHHDFVHIPYPPLFAHCGAQKLLRLTFSLLSDTWNLPHCIFV